MNSSFRKVAPMSFTRHQTLVYGVDDVGESTRFFTDFGLPLARRMPRRAASSWPMARAS